MRRCGPEKKPQRTSSLVLVVQQWHWNRYEVAQAGKAGKVYGRRSPNDGRTGDRALKRTGSGQVDQRRGHEPAYYYLVDPPGKAVVDAFLRERQPGVPAKDQPLPFFCVELPPLPLDGPPLVEVLSRALGLSMRGKWKDPFFAGERLAEHLHARQVEYVILSEAQHLSARPHGVEWLVMYFRQHLEYTPLLLVGETKQMDDLLLWKATAWVVRRFHRVQLPGIPGPSQIQ